MVVPAITDLDMDTFDEKKDSQVTEMGCPWSIIKCMGLVKGLLKTNNSKINGNFRILNWRYRFHIFLAYFSGLCFREYIPKIWPKTWYERSSICWTQVHSHRLGDMRMSRNGGNGGTPNSWMVHNGRSYNVGPPSDVRWFINPINYIFLRIINHSYWSYKPT